MTLTKTIISFNANILTFVILRRFVKKFNTSYYECSSDCNFITVTERVN